MNFLSANISPKLPFRDAFQKQIEADTREFIQKRYGTSKTVNQRIFFRDMRTLEERSIKDASDGVSRLIKVEITNLKGCIVLNVEPKEIVNQFKEKGDYRIKEGIVKPLLDALLWANRRKLEIPPKLEVELYFWIADKPAWDINNLPVFIPGGMPPGINLPLFPDISYFFYQPDAKYAGRGLIWDETKKLFEGDNPILPDEDRLYFRGCDTTRFNSEIRGEITKSLSKYIEPKYLDLHITDVCDDKTFIPLHVEGKGKSHLLDLPGKFPWSTRTKFLFLFEGSPTIIRVNERWVASDDSWEDPEDPWMQWIDTFLPRAAYVEVFHKHTQLVKTDMSAVSKRNTHIVNKNAREDTLQEIAEAFAEGIAKNPTVGHDIVMELSSDRIYQYLFRLILTMNALNKA
jgi:hypothetical protein